MTPQEKAKELYQKFYYEVSGAGTNKSIAASGALMCVDEIIKTNPTLISENYDGISHHHCNLKYWQQVKEELQKM